MRNFFLIFCFLPFVFPFSFSCAKRPEIVFSKRDIKNPTRNLVAVKSHTLSKAELRTPTRAIQDLEELLGSYRTGAHLTPEGESYNLNLKKQILRGTFDLRELSKLALARHWDTLTGGEQDEFIELLTTLLEERSIFAKERLGENLYRVKYFGDEFLDSEKKRAQTKTLVTVPSEDISMRIDYKLWNTDGDWQIYDVIADEASLIDNYRYSFDKIVVESGYSELLRRMKVKLQKIREKRQATHETK